MMMLEDSCCMVVVCGLRVQYSGSFGQGLKSSCCMSLQNVLAHSVI